MERAKGLIYHNHQMKEIRKDQLIIKIFESRTAMGEAAAITVAGKINQCLALQEEVNIIFAAAPSQNEFLSALLKQDVPWNRINAFHMDEYVKLPADAPQGFGNFLRQRLFNKADFKRVHFLNGNATDLSAECTRYAHLLAKFPTDIVCLGIGENAHLAFNDPHVANFNDLQMVKVVDLDEACKQQQVNDGCFASYNEVPTHALTLTIPALVKAKYACCIVPGLKKARAIYHTLNGNITEEFPSTILRNHQHATLFIDQDSSSLINL